MLTVTKPKSKYKQVNLKKKKSDMFCLFVAGLREREFGLWIGLEQQLQVGDDEGHRKSRRLREGRLRERYATTRKAAIAVGASCFFFFLGLDGVTLEKYGCGKGS